MRQIIQLKSGKALLFQVAMIICAAGALLVISGGVGHAAADYKVVYSFCKKDNCTDGKFPNSGLVGDSAGNLYGVTYLGGKFNAGTVYEIGADGKEKVIHDFCSSCDEGVRPTSTLVIDTSGNLYGLTLQTAFKLVPNAAHTHWKFVLLHTFCAQQDCIDGEAPTGGLTYQGAQSDLAYDGTSPLYGTTPEGGANGAGVVYRLTPKGKSSKYQVLYDFCSQADCADGKFPQTSLVVDTSGNLFGAAPAGGGGTSLGVVFELSPHHKQFSQTVLHRFCQEENCTDGGQVWMIVGDGLGNLFGVTQTGGTNGAGTVFKLVPNGTSSKETTIYNFCSAAECADGNSPQTLALDPNGNLFGTTSFGGQSENGVAFKIHGANETVLYSFCPDGGGSCSGGANPVSGFVFDGTGHIFGATAFFGGQSGAGTVFELTP